MSVAQDTTHVPSPIAKIDVDNTSLVVNAVINDLQSTISNTLEAPLKLVSETPKAIVDKSEALVEHATKVADNTTKAILKESQSVIDETTKLIDNITNVMSGKSESVIADEVTKTIISEGQAIVDETTKFVDSAVKTAENIANMVSEEEKRLTETISRLSVDMEKEAKKATSLFAKIRNFIKLIMSCTHRADKSVTAPVAVKTEDVDVNVANVV